MNKRITLNGKVEQAVYLLLSFVSLLRFVFWHLLMKVSGAQYAMKNHTQGYNYLDAILKGSKHRLNLFRHEEVQAHEERVFEKDNKYFAECLVRKKQIQLKPEEVVRQLLLGRLHHDYGYSFDRIKLEHTVQFGRSKDNRADIVIFDDDTLNTEYIIIEVKKPQATDGKRH